MNVIIILICELKVGKATKIGGADYALETVTNLVQVIPEIWFNNIGEDDGRIDEDDERIGRTASEMDSAFANYGRRCLVQWQVMFRA